jgi:putative membrane protein insertion efficiency factor
MSQPQAASSIARVPWRQRLQRWDGVLVLPLLAAVTTYRRWLSRWLPPACRFTPSCSAYAQQVLVEQPVWRAVPLVVWRLLRCQPLCAGGHDPPPLARLPEPCRLHAPRVQL